jgi:small subunit ribosomal protein S14
MLVKKDGDKRVLYKKTEIFQRLLKLIYKGGVLDIKLGVQKKIFKKVSVNSFKVRVKNFCIITGRSQGVYKKFKISRIQIRELGAKGLYFGLKKAS